MGFMFYIWLHRMLFILHHVIAPCITLSKAHFHYDNCDSLFGRPKFFLTIVFYLSQISAWNKWWFHRSNHNGKSRIPRNKLLCTYRTALLKEVGCGPPLPHCLDKSFYYLVLDAFIHFHTLAPFITSIYRSETDAFTQSTMERAKDPNKHWHKRWVTNNTNRLESRYIFNDNDGTRIRAHFYASTTQSNQRVTTTKKSEIYLRNR